MKKIHLTFVVVVLSLVLLSCSKKDDPVNNQSANTVTDEDGNVYHTVTIGTQTWMVENLKTTRYNDGTAIPLVTDGTAWVNLTTSGYCWYNNDATTYKNMYGALYNWHAVHTGKLAPTGWHVPTDTEWVTLENYLITNGYNYDGSTSGNYFAESLAATTNWATYTGTAGTIGNDLSKNNRTGFSALPGGYRDSNGFHDVRFGGYWWSSAGFDSYSTWYRYLTFNNSNLSLRYDSKGNGLSVRCVKNNLNYIITFTGSGITNTAGDVIVQNLTRGTSVTVPAGNVLNLSDTPNAVKQTSADEKPASSGLQKIISSGTTSLQYTAGDQLLYKAVSGNYSTIVTDVPTGSKTTNFNFVACTDADGNNYTVVTIGNQTWMAENLRTTRYNDGTAIPLVIKAWRSTVTPGYCWYNDDAATYKNLYGALYNWYTISTGKLAPAGWHVASIDEWATLENYLIANGYNYDGSTSGNYYAKSLAANTNWVDYIGTGTIGDDLSRNNRTGFSALPGGYHYNDGFYLAGSSGYWWSSTEVDTDNALGRHLNSGSNNLHRDPYRKSGEGFSVRCVRDN